MKELKYNLKLLFKRKEFYFALFFILLFNIFQCFMTIQREVDMKCFFNEANSAEYQFVLNNIDVDLRGIIIVVFPILCSLIISDLSWKENNTKISNVLNCRFDKTKNSLIRLFLSFIVPVIICMIGFLLNYVMMRFIFSTGPIVRGFGDAGFYQQINSNWFIDNIRVNNIYLYTFFMALVTSVSVGLLSSMAYSVSYFIKKKVLIYFFPLVFTILSEVLLSSISQILEDYSILQFLQPMINSFTVINLIVGYGVIILFCLGIEYVKHKRKDLII